MDAQGVEFIQNRAAPRAAAAVEKPPRPASVPASVNQAPADTHLRITREQQAGRDADRLAILQEELTRESRLYQTAWNALTAAEKAARDSKQTRPDLGHIQEELYEHQRNIQSINAEIGRTRIAR
jgi:hypothetical protein